MIFVGLPVRLNPTVIFVLPKFLQFSGRILGGTHIDPIVAENVFQRKRIVDFVVIAGVCGPLLIRIAALAIRLAVDPVAAASITAPDVQTAVRILTMQFPFQPSIQEKTFQSLGLLLQAKMEFHD